jgi:hypothetical protein
MRKRVPKGKAMPAQSVKIESMFAWVAQSFKLLKNNISSFMSASLVTLGLLVVMCLPMWLVMMSTMSGMMKNGGMAHGAMPMGGDMTAFFTMYGITVVVSLLAFPPILIGWFRLCQNMDHNTAVSGLDILKPYKDSQTWLRGIGFALLGMAAYIAVFGLFALAFSGAITELIQQTTAQQAAILAGAQPAPPNFPISLVFGYFGFIAIATFLQFVYMVGFTEISLRTSSPIEAMKLASAGVLKNALKLFLFFICIGIVFYIAMLIIGLILALIVMALSFIHPVAGAVAAFALFLPVMLCLYPLIFSGHYFMWKGMLEEKTAPSSNAYDATLPA